MGTSLHQSLHQLPEQPPTPQATTSVGGAGGSGQASCAGARLKGGLSSLDYPVVNSVSQQPTSMVVSSGPGGVTSSSLVSNTGSFYSTDFNSLSLVDEGQREMLSGNMSLSVLHLYETQHRRRFHSGNAGTGSTAAGHVGGFGTGRGESYSYNPMPGVIRPTAGSFSTAAKADYGNKYQMGGANLARGEHHQIPPLSTSSFAPSNLGYQATGNESSSTTPVGDIPIGTGMSYPHEGAGTMLSYPHESASSSFSGSNLGGLPDQQYPDASNPSLEHRRLARLNNKPPSIDNSNSLARDFQYNSSVVGSTETLHPLAQRFSQDDEFGSEGDSTAIDLTRPSQSSSQAVAMPRSPMVSTSPTSSTAPGARSHMPQIEEDMTGEQELDTGNLKPFV